MSEQRQIEFKTMKLKLDNLLKFDLLSDSVDALNKTLEIADDIQEPRFKQLHPLINNTASFAKLVADSSELELAVKCVDGILPFVKIASSLFEYIKKRNDPSDFTECVILACYIAYLNSIEGFLKELDVENDSELKISSPKPNKFLKDHKISEEDANDALAVFPTSKLSKIFKENLSTQFYEAGFLSPKTFWLIERAAWKAQTEIIKHWGKVPSEVRTVQISTIKDIRDIRQTEKSLSDYVNDFIEKEIERPIFEGGASKFTLRDLHVPLSSKEIHGGEGNSPSNGETYHFRSWINDILLNEDTRQVVFLQGGSGLGKTSSCKMLFDWIKKEIFPAYCPVFIRIQDIRSFEDSFQETLNSCLKSPNQGFFQSNKNWLSDPNRRFFVFLDGLDEASSEADQEIEHFIDQLFQFQEDSNNQFLITGRSFTDQEHRWLIEERNCHTVEILPLSISLRTAWIENWAEAIIANRRRRGNARRLFKDTFSIVNTSLSGNQTLLFMLAILEMAHKRDEFSVASVTALGKERDDLYRKGISNAISEMSLNVSFEEFINESSFLYTMPFDPKKLIEEMVFFLTKSDFKFSSLSELKECFLPKKPFKREIDSHILGSDKDILEKVEDLGINVEKVLGIEKDVYLSSGTNAIDSKKIQLFKLEVGSCIEVLIDKFYSIISTIDKGICDFQKSFPGEDLMLGDLFYCTYLKKEVSRKFEIFLKETCPPDIEKDFSREPFLLFLLANLYNDRAIERHLRGKEDSQARVLIYKEALVHSFGRLYKKRFAKDLSREMRSNKKIQKKEFERILESLLEELALCAVQTDGRTVTVSVLKARLSDDFCSARLFVDYVENKAISGQENVLARTLSKLLSCYYVKFYEAGKEELFEFSHKSFAEYLYAQRIIGGLKKLAIQNSGNSSSVDKFSAENEICDLLGHGKLTIETINYLKASIIEVNETELQSVFVCLNDFYSKWCEGYYLSSISGKELPWKELHERQRLYGICPNVKQSDIYTGLNVIILLLELHRYSQTTFGLSSQLAFEPSLSVDDDSTRGRENFLRAIGYCHCMEPDAISSPSTRYFANNVGQFLEKINLLGAVLQGSDLSETNLAGANLRSANLSRTCLAGTNLAEANLCGSRLILSDLRGADLTGADLTGADLSGAELSNLDFTLVAESSLIGVTLVGAHISGTNLRGVDLTGSNLSGLDLSRSDLRDTNLTDTNLTRCNLANSDLSLTPLCGAVLKNALLAKDSLRGLDLSRSNLSGLDLSGFDLTGTKLVEADLTNTTLKGAIFDSIDLSGAVLENALLGRDSLRGLDLSRSNLSGLDLSGFDLTGAILTEANLSNVVLRGANLSGLDLSERDLQNVDLQEATLRDADLSESNLSGLDLSNADLSGANLVGAILQRSLLCNAVLTDAELRDADLSEANFSSASIVGVDLSGSSLVNSTLVGADLSNADLRAVDLSKADLRNANLSNAEVSDSTLWKAAVNLDLAIGLPSDWV